MSNKIKNIVVTSLFIVFMAFFVVMCGYKYANPTETSSAERRPLAQFPEDITWQGIVDKTVIDEFEDYSVDQFPFREFFRNIKANFQLNVLQLKENNGLAIEDGYIVKIEQDFDDTSVEYSIGRLKHFYDKFVKNNGGKHYISLVPDKNYFLGKDYGYPSPNYDWLTEKVKSELSGMEYIDIFSSLELDDFYRTDTHWSQDKILGVVDTLAENMGFADRLSGEYTENKLEGFKGVYYGQSALNPTPDTLVYLTNDIINECVLVDYLENSKGSVYNFEKFGGSDGYDFFLSGTRPLLRIDNPSQEAEGTLVVFRDSYGSSILPLIAEAYSTVYVVDIRYIADANLAMYQNMNMVDFENADVLFLYSALILNQKAFK